MAMITLNTSILMGNIYLNELLIALIFWSLRFHQKQLLEETRGGCPSPPRPTQLDVERHSPSHPVQQGGAREVQQVITPAPAAAPSVRETGKKMGTLVSLWGSPSAVSVTRSCDAELSLSQF